MITQPHILEVANQGDLKDLPEATNLFQPSRQSALLQAILEGFVDGVLILSDQGEWIYANNDAHRICQQLSQRTSQLSSVPQQIWKVCKSLIDSRELFPEEKIIIESEINTNDLTFFRIRVQWLELVEKPCPYLLVTIEDQYQSTQNAVNTEAQKYNLTPRELEVWSLRRTNHSYEEIAARLYITRNTVKKHMKNIYKKLENSDKFSDL